MKKDFLCFFLIVIFPVTIFSKGVVYIETGYVGDVFNGNEVSRDDVRRPFLKLKKSLSNLGYEVKQTKRLDNLKNEAAVICFSVPRNVRHLRSDSKDRCFLFMWEPPTVMPEMYNKGKHENFGRVYTWADDLIDEKKYFKFFDPAPTFQMIDDIIPFKDKKTFVLLTRGIHRPHHLSLTSERWKLVNFFENHYEGHFDLYGRSWPKNYSKNYKGLAPTKVGCFKNYKFSFCYENMRDINGYITGEKVIHTMRAGCVPIFWGAKNVELFIPKDCFISREDFGDYDELCRYLRDMPEHEYQMYIDNIREYLASPQAHLFSAELFIDIVLSAVEPGYDKSIAFTPKQRTRLEAIKAYLKKHPLPGLPV